MTHLTLVARGNRITGTYIAPSQRPTVIFAHGFPGYNLNEDTTQALAQEGYGSLIFSYRGVRANPGEFSFRGNEEDILAAVRAVMPRRSKNGLGLLGYSLGGFHAVRLAALHQDLVDFLILMAPVASLPGCVIR